MWYEKKTTRRVNENISTGMGSFQMCNLVDFSSLRVVTPQAQGCGARGLLTQSAHSSANEEWVGRIKEARKRIKHSNKINKKYR